MIPSLVKLPACQSGLTLIETMIGLTIGLLVSLVAVSSLIVVLGGSTTVSEGYKLASAGNATLRRLALTIRQAGAVELVQTTADAPVSFGDLERRAANATGDQIVSGVDGGATSSDTLVVSYEHRDDAVTRDCLGNAPGVTPVRVDNTFSLNDGELLCVGQRGDGSIIGPTTIPAAGLPLVGDNANPGSQIAVSDFQVWYWVVNPLSPLQARRFTATDVPANGGWGAVDAVDICLQLQGFSTNNPAGNFTNCNGNSVTNGGRLQQVFRGIYRLRNRI